MKPTIGCLCSHLPPFIKKATECKIRGQEHELDFIKKKQKKNPFIQMDTEHIQLLLIAGGYAMKKLHPHLQ